MESARVSIIIPVYKRVHLLENCLASIRASSIQSYEVIIVDDGNTPDISKKIKNISEKFGVQLVYLEKNSGAPIARNRGADVASGDLLFFVDADVELTRDGLEFLVQALEKNLDAAFAYGNFLFGKQEMKGQKFSVEVLKTRNYISTMTLIRKKSFCGFDSALKRFQDWDLWLTLAERGEHGVFVDKTIFMAYPGGSMSMWLPSIVIKYARFFSWIPTVRSYVLARAIIFEKHHLSA